MASLEVMAVAARQILAELGDPSAQVPDLADIAGRFPDQLDQWAGGDWVFLEQHLVLAQLERAAGRPVHVFF